MKPVAIIGGGIIGTSIAYHLRNWERPVVLFEKNMLGAGATADSAAMLTHHHEQPKENDIALRDQSWEWYEEQIDQGVIDFENSGTLELAKTDERMDHLREVEKTLTELGVEVSLLDPSEVDQHNISGDDLQGALYLPEDGILDPAEIVQYFAEKARKSGVSIETGVEVRDISVRDGSVNTVKTSEDDIEVHTVINAAGPWAHKINDMVDNKLPIRHTKGPIVVLNTDNEVSFPFTFFEEGPYLRVEGDSQIYAGVHARGYEHAERFDPAHGQEISQSMYLEIADISDEYLPSGLNIQIANEWVGLRTVTPDSLPIVGESDTDGFYQAIAMNGYGITLAPALGELIAENLMEKDEPEKLETLNPKRFEKATIDS